jgi:hypothetical protein
MKAPGIAASAVIVAIIITLVTGEVWHWVAIIAAIVVGTLFAQRIK